MSPTVCAVVVAAGAGERLGSATPKGLVPLSGRPLVVHAAEACLAVIERIVVVAPPDHVADVRAALAGAGLRAAEVCPGGASRQQSVLHGLRACPADTGVVAIHDAARALVPPGLISATLAALVDPWDAVAPAVEVSDALKRAEGERVVQTVDREGIRAVQTPQVFHHGRILTLHERFAGQGHSDDLALVEAAGGAVRLVDGDPRNFKITHPADLLLADALLRAAREVTR